VWLSAPSVLVEEIVRDCFVGGGGGSLVRYVSEKVKRWKVDSCYDRRRESERFPHAHPPKWRTRHAVVTRVSERLCGGLLETDIVCCALGYWPLTSSRHEGVCRGVEVELAYTPIWAAVTAL
jgi:hypothetical protein